MKKIRFILLSAVLTAVFGFSFIGCSNYSSNSGSSTGSSNHDMTIELKDTSNNTYTYHADYATNDNLARSTSLIPDLNGSVMNVFKSDGTAITDDSVAVHHFNGKWYRIIIRDETGSRRVEFQTTEPRKFDSYLDGVIEESKKIVGLTINNNQYSPRQQPE